MNSSLNKNIKPKNEEDMKNYRIFAWMVATAIAGLTMVACGSDDYDAEKTLTTAPVGYDKLYAYEIFSPETPLGEDWDDLLFTEGDIEWFDLNTREIKFKDNESMFESLYNRMRPFNKIGFQLGDHFLFEVTGLVFLTDSRIYSNLVLCCGDIEGEVVDNGKFYLYDCYPLQFINEERVQDNIRKNAAQWEAFIKFLETKGKLRK